MAGKIKNILNVVVVKSPEIQGHGFLAAESEDFAICARVLGACAIRLNLQHFTDGLEMISLRPSARKRRPDLCVRNRPGVGRGGSVLPLHRRVA
jgi:hypothetical protein